MIKCHGVMINFESKVASRSTKSDSSLTIDPKSGGNRVWFCEFTWFSSKIVVRPTATCVW